MTNQAFDTLGAVRTLEASGIESRQAEAIVTVVNREDLATKADLESAVAVIRADFATLRADLYRALWVQGVGIVFVIGSLVSIAAVLKLL